MRLHHPYNMRETSTLQVLRAVTSFLFGPVFSRSGHLQQVPLTLTRPVSPLCSLSQSPCPASTTTSPTLRPNIPNNVSGIVSVPSGHFAQSLLSWTLNKCLLPLPLCEAQLFSCFSSHLSHSVCLLDFNKCVCSKALALGMLCKGGKLFLKFQLDFFQAAQRCLT